MTRRQEGFTLLELLVACAIIGIIASIATLSYMTAIQRARQKKTMTDIRTIATAWESRAADAHGFSPAGFTFPGTAVTYDDLSDTLTPTYTRNVPRYDGWGRPYAFGISANSDYAIRSAGKDGQFDETYVDGTTAHPDCDIVFANGTFIVYPDSVSTSSN